MCCHFKCICRIFPHLLPFQKFFLRSHYVQFQKKRRRFWVLGARHCTRMIPLIERNLAEELKGKTLRERLKEICSLMRFALFCIDDVFPSLFLILGEQKRNFPHLTVSLISNPSISAFFKKLHHHALRFPHNLHFSTSHDSNSPFLVSSFRIRKG